MEKKYAWLVAVNMGYGHQRTAHPLKNLAFRGVVINANDYEGIPKRDRQIWENSRKFYEFISRFRRIPLIGKIIFRIYDKFQKILTFYPKRDLSRPNFMIKRIYSLIRKKWGKHLIEKLKIKEPNLPFISTFFTPVFMAEIFNYPGEIYCVVCDTDIARTWAPLNPGNSKIKYFAPCNRVKERLKLYGVKKENIFLTGYPLPKENIGSEKMEILKQDLSYRILNLDPKGRYCSLYKPLLDYYLGSLPQKPNHLLTLMFSIGGAGAQKEIGLEIIKSLKEKIKEEKIKVILAVGIREKIKEYFLREINNLGLKSLGLEIIFSQNIYDYFEKFNQALRKTDILWTKPSELSFYSGLGIPIIIAPPLGSQEEFNKRWLLRIGSGILQGNPSYTKEWLFDLIERGRLAESAMNGFLEIEKLGTYKIEKIIFENFKSSF